jgi:hypothetical protein
MFKIFAIVAITLNDLLSLLNSILENPNFVMFQTPKHLISSPTKPYFRRVPLKNLLKLKLKVKTVVKKEEMRDGNEANVKFL